MRTGGHDRKPKTHRGRHTFPSPLRTVTGRSGKAIAVVAVLAAVAVAPQVYRIVSNATSAATLQEASVDPNLYPKVRTAHSAPLAVVTHVPVIHSAPHHSRQPDQHHVVVHRHRARHVAHAPAPKPASPAPTKATVACSGTASGPMLPQNYAAIVNFLVNHGYTALAAAGIAGNIYQESGGNPESVGTGGGGLIGWTPLPPGYVTGNPAADLQTQLNALLAYNQQWSQYIPALNAATSATQAADIYMNDFERPGLPAAANRESAANAVAAACGL
jgi:hypothetical protein